MPDIASRSLYTGCRKSSYMTPESGSATSRIDGANRNSLKHGNRYLSARYSGPAALYNNEMFRSYSESGPARYESRFHHMHGRSLETLRELRSRPKKGMYETNPFWPNKMELNEINSIASIKWKRFENEPANRLFPPRQATPIQEIVFDLWGRILRANWVPSAYARIVGGTE